MTRRGHYLGSVYIKAKHRTRRVHIEEDHVGFRHVTGSDKNVSVGQRAEDAAEH